MKNLLIGLMLLGIGSNVYAQAAFTCGETLIDSRDGQHYKTIQIGSQCWMQENLNIGVARTVLEQKDNDSIEKTCYKNDLDMCGIYGGLYSWREAMKYMPAETQGICPDGWHLPSNDEWRTLNEFLGVKMTGQKMKVSGDHVPKWDGDNSSGFTALPSGVGYEDRFGRLGYWAVFWTSTEKDADYAWSTQLDNYWTMDKYPTLYQGDHFLKENAFSIRCIKNTK